MLVKDAFLMKCGHAANASHNGEPCCVICYPKAGWDVVDDNPPNLEGREARCDCGAVKPSNVGLPFFAYRPNLDCDRYYCGCRGWN